MPATGNTIAFRTGTYRTATPEETWRRIAPQLDRFAITRVADITRLDEIGLPVHVAYRPVGTTIAVSIGTGLTPEQSRVSAVMESIEVWHGENPCLDIAARGSARDIGLPYDVRSLNLAPRSPLTDAVVLDWVAGTGLLTDAPRLVPLDAIRLDFTGPPSWASLFFRPSSNGQASGNSPAEATLHALLELIERDCIARMASVPQTQRRRVDPASSRHPHTAAVFDRLRTAGCRVEVGDITSCLGIPCFVAYLWSEDLPVVFGGFGCHVDADIAVGRAMTEAVQSRLGVVSGARDDIVEQAYQAVADGQLISAGEPIDTAPPPVDGDDLNAVVRYCTKRVAEATGVEPFVVDLTHADVGIPVSKVFAPGLGLSIDPRPPDPGSRLGDPVADLFGGLA